VPPFPPASAPTFPPASGASHTPALHVPAAHTLPFPLTGVEQTPDAGSHTPVVWQSFAGVQLTGSAPTQAPLWHVSVWVQAFRSSHGAPFGAGASAGQVPVAVQYCVVSQAPLAAWHTVVVG